MKKRIIALVCAVAVITAVLLGLTACNKTGNGGKSSSDVSRETSAFYAGESKLFAVSVECGRREKTFIADGKATDVNDFCEITVTPLVTMQEEEINFVLANGTSTLSGTLTSGGFGIFSAEITADFAPKTVTVTAGDKSSDIELQNVLEGALSSSDIINIAKKEFAERIDKEKADGKYSREIYVKLITGDRATYYYYVSFIGESVNYWAMLVDPVTGDVISSK